MGIERGVALIAVDGGLTAFMDHLSGGASQVPPQITLASPKGGHPPLDPKSNEPNFQTDITRRFEKDADANAQLARTVRLDSVKQEDHDTVFCPGGHGPMWDLAEDENSIKLLDSFAAAGKTFTVSLPFDRCTAPSQDPGRQAVR